MTSAASGCLCDGQAGREWIEVGRPDVSGDARLPSVEVIGNLFGSAVSSVTTAYTHTHLQESHQHCFGSSQFKRSFARPGTQRSLR